MQAAHAPSPEQESASPLEQIINSFFAGERVPRESIEQLAADAVSSIVGRRVTVEEIRSGHSRVGQIDIDIDGFRYKVSDLYSRVSSRVRGASSSSSRKTPEQRAEEQARRQREQQANRAATEKSRQVSRARRILGYTAKEPVTKDMVKQRQRELARKHHPDRPGGSTQKMQEINWAVDILLSPQ